MGKRTTRLLGIFTAEQTSAVNEHRTRKKIGEKLSTHKTFCDSCTHYTKHLYVFKFGLQEFLTFTTDAHRLHALLATLLLFLEEL